MGSAYCTLRSDRLTRVPAGLDPAETAALISSWTTAYQLLVRAVRAISDALAEPTRSRSLTDRPTHRQSCNCRNRIVHSQVRERT
jgi:hypothetical protein